MIFELRIIKHVLVELPGLCAQYTDIEVDPEELLSQWLLLFLHAQRTADNKPKTTKAHRASRLALSKPRSPKNNERSGADRLKPQSFQAEGEAVPC